MKTVITFGTFDHFHAGHENYLRQARELGDKLVCIVARDETVKKLKGKSPDFSEKDRLKSVRRSGLADKAVLGNFGDKYDVIRKFRPDIVALGYDQFAFTFGLKKLLIEEKINAKIVRMEAYEPGIFKSSIIKYAKSAPATSL